MKSCDTCYYSGGWSQVCMQCDDYNRWKIDPNRRIKELETENSILREKLAEQVPQLKN